MVKKEYLLFNKYILHKRKYLYIQESDADLLRHKQYKDSPLQNNGCDCGIFAVGATLHLAERIPLTSRSFLQTHVTKAWSELAKILCSKSAVMESAIFRDCFPLLRGRSIVDASGVEVIITVWMALQKQRNPTVAVLGLQIQCSLRVMDYQARRPPPSTIVGGTTLLILSQEM